MYVCTLIYVYVCVYKHIRTCMTFVLSRCCIVRQLLVKMFDLLVGGVIMIGGVTIHRLLKLPIEHEGRGAGYWKLAKETLKIMRTSLSKLKLLIVDEVSMVSSLNLAYIHLRVDDIFA